MQWALVGLVLPLIIGMFGGVFKRLALPGKMPAKGWPGWQGVYYVTFPLHSLFAGAVFGLFMFQSNIPWPTDVFGTSLGSAVLAGSFAGGIAMIAYDSIVKTIRNAICHFSLKGNENAENGESQ